MKRKLLNLEYHLRSSPKILFRYLSTPDGLSAWFAENVTVSEKIYTFVWDNEFFRATLTSYKENKLVRFTWVESSQEYFQFELFKGELTGDIALEVTDFFADGDETEKRRLWDSQIDALTSLLGA